MKRILSLLLIAIFLASVFNVPVFAEGPIEISTPEQLYNVRNNLSGDYVMVSDIDLSDTVWGEVYAQQYSNGGWEPIANFSGTFDGGGHIINGLYIDRLETDRVGLFGESSGATIQNLGLTDTKVFGQKYVGGLVGYCSGGSISNVFINGSITGLSYVGALVGSVRSSNISNTYTTAAVAGSSDTGGLVGYSFEASINRSYAVGTVSGGGFIGFNEGSIFSSFWDTQASGVSTSAGGTGQTTVELKQQDTFSDWDFENIWSIEQGTYPYFKWQSSHIDYAAPAFVNGYPKADNITEETIDMQLMMDEDNVLHYVILPEGEEAPNAAQVEQGTDAHGVSLPETHKGSVILAANVTTTQVLTGMQAGAAYDFYFVTEDAEGNQHFGKTWFLALSIEFGDGSSENPYQITSAEQLVHIQYNLDKNYILMNDIDMADFLSEGNAGYNDGAGWKPIGEGYGNPFTGSFDGNEHVIKNLYINRPDTNCSGLFAYAKSGASFSNLGLLDVDITGKDFVGSLLGRGDSTTTVTSSWAAGSVSGIRYVGGLSGHIRGTVTNCYAVVSVESTGSLSKYTGGLIGSLDNSESAVYSSFAAGAVSGESSNVGGLAGDSYNSNNASLSYWDMETTRQSSSYGGGTGQYTAAMKTSETFTDWDFTDTWNIVDGQTYPYLKWQNDNFDFAPPAFAENYPKTTGITMETANLHLQVDEDSTAYYVILPFGEDTPTAMQIKQGTDASGSVLAENRKGNLILSSGTEEAKILDGLSPEAKYNVYAVVEDLAGNLQPDNCISIMSITTSPDAIGSGTPESPYQIGTVEQLEYMRLYPDKHFVLTNNIDMSEYAPDQCSYIA